jgi:APA family basic amino acid/polyamine antiporter
MALFAFISGFGALNGWILVQGEMPRVLARDGIFPKIFGLESRYGTPSASLFITSALVTIVVLMNYSASMVKVFTFIILVSTSAYLVMYLFCALAALKLAVQGEMGVHGRRMATLLVVAMLAAIYSAWTLYGAGKEAFWWAMALIAAGVPVYLLMRWWPSIVSWWRRRITRAVAASGNLQR